MFKKPLLKLLKSKVDVDVKRELLMEALRKATQSGYCVILGESKEGTRVIVLGKSTYRSQLDQIAKDKGVVL